MRFILLFSGLLFLATSCEKETEVLFELPLQNLDFVIPAGQNTLETYYVNFPQVPTNYDALLSNLGYEDADIMGIIPGAGRLSAIFGDGDFDDLFREFVVQICPSGSTTNKCGVEGFYWDLVGQNVGIFMDLIPNPIDVSDDLSEETVTIQIWYRLLRTTDLAIESRVSLDFLVQ
jgi:hypothetical protein